MEGQKEGGTAAVGQSLGDRVPLIPAQHALHLGCMADCSHQNGKPVIRAEPFWASDAEWARLGKVFFRMANMIMLHHACRMTLEQSCSSTVEVLLPLLSGIGPAPSQKC